MALGVIFPGQGSQSVGMLADVVDAFPAAQGTFQEADEALGFQLSELILNGPADDLNRTENTQPALLTASVALWRVLEQHGAAPLAVAGHSLGEYSALVAAGAMRFDQAVRLVRKRGELMQKAVPEGEGAMAAILGLDEEAITAVCDGVEGVVTPANFNAPGQIVIAGAADAVASAAEACKEAGAKRALMLDVSVPSHCALMASISDEFQTELDAVELTLPSVPVVQNVTGVAPESVDTLRQQLVAQLASPVRWTSCVAQLTALGVKQLIECGPGNVLAGLAKRIDRSLKCAGTGSVAALEGALATLKEDA